MTISKADPHTPPDAFRQRSYDTSFRRGRNWPAIETPEVFAFCAVNRSPAIVPAWPPLP